jgi:transcriptional regulator with XRE-family HTH domain
MSCTLVTGSRGIIRITWQTHGARKRYDAPLSDEPIYGRVTRLRKEYGYTQAEVAERLGITQSDISAYERGARRFHAETIAQYAQLLGVNAEELVGLHMPRNGQNLSVHLTKRMQRIQRLPKSRQKALLQTIDLFLKGAEQ